jgi:hypothetical protein
MRRLLHPPPMPEVGRPPGPGSPNHHGAGVPPGACASSLRAQAIGPSSGCGLRRAGVPPPRRHQRKEDSLVDRKRSRRSSSGRNEPSSVWWNQ